MGKYPVLAPAEVVRDISPILLRQVAKDIRMTVDEMLKFR